MREKCAGFDLSILEKDFGLLRIREKDEVPPLLKPDRRILENDPGALRMREKEDVGERRILENEAPLNIRLYASSSLLPDLNILEKLPRLSASPISLSPAITCSISTSFLSTGLADVKEFVEMQITRKKHALIPISIKI